MNIHSPRRIVSIDFQGVVDGIIIFFLILSLPSSYIKESVIDCNYFMNLGHKANVLIISIKYTKLRTRLMASALWNFLNYLSKLIHFGKASGLVLAHTKEILSDHIKLNGVYACSIGLIVWWVTSASLLE